MEERILELYRQRMSLTKIGETVGASYWQVREVVRKAIASGKVERRESILKCAKTDTQKYKVKQTIKKLYEEGNQADDIAKKMGYSYKTIIKYIREMVADGEMCYVRKRRDDKPGKALPQKYQKVPSTLKEGETVKCNKVYRTCVYGSSHEHEYYAKCNYSRITGECRSLICKHEACTCYSKISKRNPRLTAYGEDR